MNKLFLSIDNSFIMNIIGQYLQKRKNKKYILNFINELKNKNDVIEEIEYKINMKIEEIICFLTSSSNSIKYCKVFVSDLPDLGTSGNTISSAPIISAAFKTRLKSKPSPNSQAELSKILKLPIPLALSFAKKLKTSGFSKTL